MPLLERESQLASLRQYAAEARDRAGRLVLVSGEAGVGKSSLVEELQDELADATWVWGACDGLFTPRPLAPLRDVARSVGGELLRGCPRRRCRATRCSTRRCAGSRTQTAWSSSSSRTCSGPTTPPSTCSASWVAASATSRCCWWSPSATTRSRPADTLRVALGELAGLRWTRRIDLPPLSARRSTPAGRGHDVPPRGAAPADRRQPVLPGRGARSRRRRGARPRRATRSWPGRRASTRPPGRRSRSPRSTATGSTRPGRRRGRRSRRSRRSTSWSRPACCTSDGDDAALPARAVAAGGRVRGAAAPARGRPPRPDRRPARPRVRRRRRAAGLPRRGSRRRDLVARFAPAAAAQAAGLGAHRESAAQYERALRFPPTTTRARRALRRVRRRSSPSSTAGRRLPRRAAAPSRSGRRSGDARREGHGHRKLAVRDVATVPRARVGRRPWSGPSQLLEPLGADPELARAYAAHAFDDLGTDPDAGRRDARSVRGAMADAVGDPAVRSDVLNNVAAGAFIRREDWTCPMNEALRLAPRGRRRGPGRSRLRERLHLLRDAAPLRRGRALLARRHRLLRRARHHDLRHLPARPPGRRPAGPRPVGRGGGDRRAGPRHRGEPGQPAHLADHARPDPGAAWSSRRVRRARPRRRARPTASTRPSGSRAPGWPAPKRTGSPGDDGPRPADLAPVRPCVTPMEYLRGRAAERLGAATARRPRSPVSPAPEPWATWLAGDHAAAAAHWDRLGLRATTLPWRSTTPTATTTCGRRSPASRRSAPTPPYVVPAGG